jgi:hypothetical protein
MTVASLLTLGRTAGVAAQRGGGSGRDTLQLPPQVRALGTGVSTSDVIERLRRSGMTRSQMRAALQRVGYDPCLADR